MGRLDAGSRKLISVHAAVGTHGRFRVEILTDLRNHRSPGGFLVASATDVA